MGLGRMCKVLVGEDTGFGVEGVGEFSTVLTKLRESSIFEAIYVPVRSL